MAQSGVRPGNSNGEDEVDDVESVNRELNAEPQWYACYTRAHHERRVARVLRDRGIEEYLPVVVRKRQWHDRVKEVAFPLFPGYLFARIAKSQFFEVTCVPSVVSLVTVEGKPVPIRPEEVDNIRRFAEALSLTGSVPEPEPFLAAGVRVMITGGPFAGIEGRVEESRGTGRVLVGLAALGNGFALNVAVKHLEPMPER